MGRAASRLLAELGANVYATVRRHPLDFPVKREIPSELGTREGLDALVAELPPVIDALFVCHGISNSVGMTNGLEVQLTNFLSFRYLTEALLPRMSEGSSVTFISSNGGWEWRERAAACMELIETAGWDEALAWYASHPELTNDGYVFAKQCQNVYVHAKVHDPAFVSRHVRINVIAPGLTKTGLTDDFNRSLTGGCRLWPERPGGHVPLYLEWQMGDAGGDGLPDGGAGKQTVQLRQRSGALHRLGIGCRVGAGDHFERMNSAPGPSRRLIARPANGVSERRGGPRGDPARYSRNRMQHRREGA